MGAVLALLLQSKVWNLLRTFSWITQDVVKVSHELVRPSPRKLNTQSSRCSAGPSQPADNSMFFSMAELFLKRQLPLCFSTSPRTPCIPLLPHSALAPTGVRSTVLNFTLLLASNSTSALSAGLLLSVRSIDLRVDLLQICTASDDIAGRCGLMN